MEKSPRACLEMEDLPSPPADRPAPSPSCGGQECTRPACAASAASPSALSGCSVSIAVPASPVLTPSPRARSPAPPDTPAPVPPIVCWFLQSGLGPCLRAESPPQGRHARYHPTESVFVPQLLSWVGGGGEGPQPPPEGIQSLCFPAGVRLVHSRSAGGPLPTYFTFVSTGTLGDKLFGHCLTVYAPVSRSQLFQLGGDGDPAPLFAPLCLCVLSRKLHVEAEELLSKVYAAHISHSTVGGWVDPTRVSIASPSSSSAAVPYATGGCDKCTAIMTPLLSVLEPPPQDCARLAVGTSVVMVRHNVPRSPLDPVCVPFDDVFRALSVGTIVALWTACLLERQIILHSSQLSLLHKTTEVLQSLLFPFKWIHALIPVLPHDTMGPDGFEAVMSAPTPFIVGLPTPRWQRIVAEAHEDTHTPTLTDAHTQADTLTHTDTHRHSEVPACFSGAIVLDVDRDVLCVGEDGTLPALPSRVYRSLLTSLKAAGVCALALEAGEWRENRLGHMDTGLQDVPLTPEDATATFAYPVPPLPTPASPPRQATVTPRRATVPPAVMWYQCRRSFFNAIASLLLDYWQFVAGSPSAGRRVSFDAVGFVNGQPKSFRPFLAQLVSTTHFSALVYSRAVRTAGDDSSAVSIAGSGSSSEFDSEYEPASEFLDAWISGAGKGRRASLPSPRASLAAIESAERASVAVSHSKQSGNAVEEGGCGEEGEAPKQQSWDCCGWVCRGLFSSPQPPAATQ